MRGEELKNFIRRSGFPFSEVARRIGLTRQELHGKLLAQSVKSDLVEQVAKAIGVEVALLYGQGPVTQRNVSGPNILGHEVDFTVNGNGEGEDASQDESRAEMRARHDAEIAFYQSQIRSMQAQIERLLRIIERGQGEQ